SDVIEQVVNATMAVADAAGLGWTREEEIKAVVARVKSSLALLHREYDPTTGSIPNWLAAGFHNDWIPMLERGACPVLRRTGFGSGWCVKAASGSPRPEDEPSRRRRKPQNDDEPSAGKEAGVKKAAAPRSRHPSPAGMALWATLPAPHRGRHGCARRYRKDNAVYGRGCRHGHSTQPAARAAHGTAAGVVSQRRGQHRRTQPPPCRHLPALRHSHGRTPRLVVHDLRQ